MTPDLSAWTWVVPFALLWSTAWGGLVIGPHVREYSTGDYVMWALTVAFMPVAMVGALAMRHRLLASAVPSSVSASVWIFTDGVYRSSPSGEPVRGHWIRKGWMTISGDVVSIVSARDTSTPVVSVPVAQVVELSRVTIVPGLFSPVLRIDLADGARVELRIVRAGLAGAFGVRRRGFREIEDAFTAAGYRRDGLPSPV